MVAGRLRSLPDMPEVKTFKCHQEITEPDRAGFIQYTNMGYTNGTCSIVFRGEQRDMVIINMDTLILRSNIDLLKKRWGQTRNLLFSHIFHWS